MNILTFPKAFIVPPARTLFASGPESLDAVTQNVQDLDNGGSGFTFWPLSTGAGGGARPLVDEYRVFPFITVELSGGTVSPIQVVVRYRFPSGQVCKIIEEAVGNPGFLHLRDIEVPPDVALHIRTLTNGGASDQWDVTGWCNRSGDAGSFISP